MLFGRLLGDEQHEELSDRSRVRGVEWNRRLEPQESAGCFRQALAASVRNRDALAETGRTQLFARGETRRHERSRQSRVALEKRADPLEQRGLRVDVDVDG